MNYGLALNKIYPGIGFNQACFNFTEEESREKGLWTDSRPMPTTQELEDALVKAEKEMADELVKKEYEEEGLTHDLFLQLLMDDDELGAKAFKAKRKVIKDKYTKKLKKEV